MSKNWNQCFFSDFKIILKRQNCKIQITEQTLKKTTFTLKNTKQVIVLKYFCSVTGHSPCSLGEGKGMSTTDEEAFVRSQVTRRVRWRDTVYCCFSLHLSVDFGVCVRSWMDDGSWGMKAGGTSGGMTEAHHDREKRLNLGFRLRSSSVVMQFQRCFCKGNLGACCFCTIHPTAFPQALLCAVCPGEGGRPSFVDWLLQLR